MLNNLPICQPFIRKQKIWEEQTTELLIAHWQKKKKKNELQHKH